MFRLQEGDAVIEMYKHGIIRRYLMLDQHNRAYVYTGESHVQIREVVTYCASSRKPTSRTHPFERHTILFLSG